MSVVSHVRSHEDSSFSIATQYPESSVCYVGLVVAFAWWLVCCDCG